MNMEFKLNKNEPIHTSKVLKLDGSYYKIINDIPITTRQLEEDLVELSLQVKFATESEYAYYNDNKEEIDEKIHIDKLKELDIIK